jgi:hypothetical protein
MEVVVGNVIVIAIFELELSSADLDTCEFSLRALVVMHAYLPVGKLPANC